MAEVLLQDGESLESALRRFKRKVLQEGIIKDIKRHAFYLKPGHYRRAAKPLGSDLQSSHPTRTPRTVMFEDRYL